ncbi:MAG: WGR domain-containing protein [Acidobacteria bacterium]|nr:WGR domain-containing protein [Acidobacteriota bacterium]
MTTIQKISLYFIGGGSDKVYNAQIVQVDSSFVVNFQYGRRGSTLTAGTKTTSPVPYEQAKRVYDTIVKEKTGKGYKLLDGQNNETTVPVPDKTAFGHVPQLLNAITEDEALRLLTDSHFILQEKHDGERRMVRKHDVVTASNRKGEEVGVTAEIVTAMADFPACVLDGEHVGEVLYVFDLLALEGKNVEALPYITRLAHLTTLPFNNTIRLVAPAHTTDEKQAVYLSLQAEAEGVVFKRTDAPYIAGRPNSGGDQLKYKFYETATCHVRTVNNKRSVEVELRDGNQFVPKGNVTIPPNQLVPTVGQLIEVRYLYAYPGEGSLYQPTFIRLRNDVECDDVSGLKYKN